MIHLDHRDSRPIYVQIADAIRRQVETGVLAPGDKLPSVRELSAQLTINPNTIQRAYRELENGGWIQSAPGKGSFVLDRVRPEHAQPPWQAFDDAVRALLGMGVPAETLTERIRQAGGANDA